MTGPLTEPVVLTGMAVLAAMLLWGPLRRRGLGRLPGDVTIGGRVCLPLASATIVGLVLAILATLTGRWLTG